MWSSGKCRTLLLLLLVGALLSGTGAVAVVYAEFRVQAFRPADATNDLVSGEAWDPDGDGLVNLRLAANQVTPAPAELRWVWFEAESSGGESGAELSNGAMTRDPFTPRGKLKPDEVLQVTQPGWFAFQPAPDPYGFSPIDLRYLNERQAGDHGFVRVEGEDFVHGQTRTRPCFGPLIRRPEPAATFLMPSVR